MNYKKIAAVLAAVAIIGSSSYAITDALLFKDVVTVSAASSLRKNATGSEVTQLQNNLIKLGYLKSGSATGKYDTATENAVKQFQSDYHLTADGIAGNKTLNMISSIISGATKAIEVKATLLNVRETPSPQGKLVTTVKAGQKYTVEDEASESDGTKWYKIKTNVGAGYVCSDYVVVTVKASEPVQTTNDKNGIIKVTGSVLNVRKSASTSAKKLYTVKAGQTYYYTNMKKVNGDTWYYINVNKKISGWVLGKWATPIQSTEETTSSSKSGKLKVIVDILQVRKSTSTTSKRLYTTKRDEEYSYSNVKTVDGVNWYYIKVNSSVSGWVLGTMVEATPKNSQSTTASTQTEKTTKVTSTSPDGGTLTVNVNLLNVRESTSTSSKKLFTAKKDDVYSYSKTKKVDGVVWYYIKVNNSISGWVIGTMVKATPNQTETTTEATQTEKTTVVTSANPDGGTLTVNVDLLNVRESASTSSKKLFTAKKDDVYSYSKTKKADGVNWYYIKVNNSISGWVMGTYVTPKPNTTAKATETTTSTQADAEQISGKLKVTASILNVRSEAGANSQIVTTVKKDTTYSFTQVRTADNEKWYYITVSSTEKGWVMGSYVKVVTEDEPAPSTTKSGTLTVIGTSVNVRSGAGTNYSKLTTVKKDTTFTYTEVKNSWYCIKLSSDKTGWIIGDYVRINESESTTAATAVTTTTTTTVTTASTTTATTATTTSKTDSSEPDRFSPDTSEAKPSPTQKTETTDSESTTAKNTNTTTGVPVSPTAAASLTKNLTTGVVKSSSSLVVRKGPGTNYASIGSLANGSTVVIVAKGSSWHEIEYGQETGYVSSSYIKNIKTQIRTDNLSYAEDYYYISPGQSINLERDMNGAAVSYSSSDSVKCPVTDKGVASGVKEGLYTITAHCNNSTSSVCIVVLKNPNSNIQPLKLSDKAADFIANWEGGETILPNGKKVFYPYKDVSGFWTLGYGHAKTATASKSWSENRAIAEFNDDIVKLIGEEYILSDDRPYLSEDAAKLLLNADLNSGDYVKAVNNWAIRNGVKLNQVQFDALVSFCYNIGPSLWESDTTKFYLKSAIIAYRDGSKTVPDQIIDGFCRYHKSNGKAYKCLWFRRRNEAELFLTGDYNIDRENKFRLPTDISWS